MISYRCCAEKGSFGAESKSKNELKVMTSVQVELR
jgi:hypothetical protein